MAKYVIVDSQGKLDKLLTNPGAGPEPYIWLWDEDKPNERIYLSGNCPAYVPGDRVEFLTRSGSPKENELMFKQT